MWRSAIPSPQSEWLSADPQWESGQAARSSSGRPRACRAHEPNDSIVVGKFQAGSTSHGRGAYHGRHLGGAMPRAHKPTSRPRAGALTADRPPLVAAPDAPEVTALVDRLRASLAEPATVPDLLAGVPLPVAAAGLAALRQEVGAAAVPLLERAAELEDDALAAAALDQLGTLPDASAAEAL